MLRGNALLHQFILFVAGLCMATHVCAADDVFLTDRWTVEHGLPVNGVTALHRDPGGYLWLATFDGLTRFDGERFVVFDSAPVLGSRRLLDARRSPDGAPWVLGEIRSVLRDAAGDLWIGQSDGTLLRTRGDAILDIYRLPAGCYPAQINAITQAADGAILAATRTGVARVAGSAPASEYTLDVALIDYDDPDTADNNANDTDVVRTVFRDGFDP